jgi:dihydrolipoamide dehydrogenase
MRDWKSSIVNKLAQGVAGLASRRNVEIIIGKGYFEDSKTLRIETPEGQKMVGFDKAVIAVGSSRLCLRL